MVLQSQVFARCGRRRSHLIVMGFVGLSVWVRGKKKKRRLFLSPNRARECASGGSDGQSVDVVLTVRRRKG